jgi:hypothetical protein
MGRLVLSVYICIYLCFAKIFVILNVAVTAPAGFPDHPHRGLIIGFFFFFFSSHFCKLSLPVNIKIG